MQQYSSPLISSSNVRISVQYATALGLSVQCEALCAICISGNLRVLYTVLLDTFVENVSVKLFSSLNVSTGVPLFNLQRCWACLCYVVDC